MKLTRTQKRIKKSNRIFLVSTLLLVGITASIIFLPKLLSPAAIYYQTVLGLSNKEYYISPSGNDSNTGTSSAPLKTFSKAQSLASAGDTIHVGIGTYTSMIDVTKSGLTITGHNAVIDANGLQKAINIRAKDIVMSGFETMHSNSHTVYIEGENVSFSNSSIHDSVYENRKSDGMPKHGSWGSGLSIKYPAKNVKIDNVTIYNVYGEALDINAADSVTVTNSTVYDSYSIGYYIDNSKNVILDRNFAYCTGDNRFKRSNGKDMGAFSMALENVEKYFPGWGAQLKNIRITNNISYGCNGLSLWGSEIGDGLKDAYIAHNSILKVSGTALWIASLPANSNIQIVNNLLGSTIDAGSGTTKTGNLTGVQFSITDYKASAIKPTVGQNKGVVSEVKGDFVGNIRDNSPDVGAWEIGSTTPATPVPTSLPTLAPTPTPTPTTKPTVTATPLPTSTTTSTPTATPTATPKSTTTPTPTVKPTPTLKPSSKPTTAPNSNAQSNVETNSNPVLKPTWSSLHAIRNTSYSSTFYAIDKNLGDNLQMQIIGLPEGVTLNSCTSENWWSQQGFKCIVSGKPKTPGKYRIQIYASDNHGGFDERIVTFRVW